MFLTGSIFPIIIFVGAFLLNFIALYYDSLAHIPFGTMMVMLLLWVFVVMPLTLCGVLVGRSVSDESTLVTPIPKVIPSKQTYQSLWFHLVFGGLFPFGSIFIEMYFVFTAFWQLKYYYVFGFLLLVYIILIIVTACSSVISTYFLLNSEDYRWQWVSFATGASTSAYVYLYAVYYFMNKTRMTGFLEAVVSTQSTGYELVESNIKINFKEKIDTFILCTVSLSQEKRDAFAKAVQNEYWFEFFLDGLPIWGWVGEVNDDGPHVYTHFEFNIKYNEDRVIEVRLEERNPVELKVDGELKFSYSVAWEQTSEPFEARFDKYLDNKFFEHQVHWFSLFNSCMMVVFLVAIVMVILMRTLKKDLARFNQNPDEAEDPAGIDFGWKQVSGDVFRQPSNLPLFSALVGSGTQLVTLVFFLILLSIIFYHNRPFSRHGTLVTTFVVLYSLTSLVAGYVSGRYYKRNKGKNWIWCMFLTGSIFPIIIFVGAFLLNFIALYYDSLAHIPFGTMMVMLLLWVFVVMPLTLCGVLVGRSVSDESTLVTYVSLVTSLP
eukprot:TRINITY_DN10607_c0_g1_i1.p1 TRINITY_DN10607_c0_g1~~TRINITY_DN10607_c0_g1_i1.p1  ORF type:complete len:547 (-),score=105.17 TRINITY_DN10607_c0_g1_i1:94-1734(-)